MGTHKYDKGVHDTMPASMGKAGRGISSHYEENWTQKPPMKDKTGPARRRRTMPNRGQGTGLAGKGSKRLKIPKVTASGHYPLYGE